MMAAYLYDDVGNRFERNEVIITLVAWYDAYMESGKYSKAAKFGKDLEDRFGFIIEPTKR